MHIKHLVVQVPLLKVLWFVDIIHQVDNLLLNALNLYFPLYLTVFVPIQIANNRKHHAFSSINSLNYIYILSKIVITLGQFNPDNVAVTSTPATLCNSNVT